MEPTYHPISQVAQRHWDTLYQWDKAALFNVFGRTPKPEKINTKKIDVMRAQYTRQSIKRVRSRITAQDFCRDREREFGKILNFGKFSGIRQRFSTLKSWCFECQQFFSVRAKVGLGFNQSINQFTFIIPPYSIMVR